ncbi:MAG: sugar phosphate isomerase/epimerase family protein [Tepidisphaeraceae bacterium]
MNIAGHDIGVCDWSLRPETPGELVEQLESLGLSHVQLALSKFVDLSEADRADVLGLYENAGIAITAGMLSFADENYASIASIRRTGGFVSPRLWPERRDRAIRVAQVAAGMGITLVTAHAGFIPPSRDPDYGQVVSHLSQLAAAYAEAGVELALETGQEKATELLQFLNDLNADNVGVNFDPANMILYGAGSPVEAVATLGRHIRHVHIKDANPSPQPGIEWGTEVPFGRGSVEVHAFLLRPARCRL